MLWKWNYIGAVTEGFNYSDVLGVKRTLYTAEFEIKLSISDLNREIKAIEECLKVVNKVGIFKDHSEYFKWRWNNKRFKFDKNISSTKLNKHFKYLYTIKDKNVFDDFIPNEFNFLVPEKFADIISRLKHTPYGLFLIGERHHSYYDYEFKCNKKETYYEIEKILKPKKLHKNKIEKECLASYFRKLSTENQFLREKIYQNT